MAQPNVLLVCTDDQNPAFVRDVGQLAFALSSGRDVSVHILSSLKEKSPFEDIRNVHVLSAQDANFTNCGQILALKEYLQTEKVDVVHFPHFYPHQYKMLRLCQKLDVPVTVETQHPRIFKEDQVSWWQRSAYKDAMHRCWSIVVNALHIQKMAEENGFCNVERISEGVQLERFKPVLSKRPLRRELKLPESSTLVCCMANIKPENRQLEVLESCLPLGHWLNLLFVGEVEDEYYMEELKAAIQRHDVEPHVIFRSTVDYPEDYLKASDVFMLLGGVEARRQTILEALASGVPVVLGPSASSEDLIYEGRVGMVLYHNNVMAKQGVEKLLHDSNYRQSKVHHSRDFVKKDYAFKDRVGKYVQLYKSV